LAFLFWGWGWVFWQKFFDMGAYIGGAFLPKLAFAVKKVFWLSLLATGVWGLPCARAQAIPVPEILPPGVASGPPRVFSGESSSEAESLRQRWALLAQQFREMESNADYATAFLVSKELRTCQCTRPDAWAILRALDEGRFIEGGTNAELRCGFCMVQKYAQWQERISQQCALMLVLSPFELQRLEKSDDVKGLPKHCFERARLASKPQAEAQAEKAEVEQPRVIELLTERKEFYRYLRVVAGPTCKASVLGTGLELSNSVWLEIPPGVRQLRLRSRCQATVEVYRGMKAAFEQMEHLPAGESVLLQWGK